MGVVDRDAGVSLVDDWLCDDDILLVGHNMPYDLGVIAAAEPKLLPVIFEKYERGLIVDTMTRQIMIDVAEGQAKYFIDEETGEFKKSSYTLADLSYRLNKRFVKKGSDTWRLRYALLDGVPISAWPDDAKKYAIDDSEITLEVFEAQEELIKKAHWTWNDDAREHALPNSADQHRASWALHLMSTYGVRTDGTAVAELKKALDQDYAEQMEKLRPSGLFNITPPRINRKGRHIPEIVTKNMKAIHARVEKCFKDRNEEPPRTATGLIQADRKALMHSGDPELVMLAEAGATQKLRTTYVPALEGGVCTPICPRYNSPLETGRTSCSGPNLQNPPRKGGVRECFVPRRGWAYVFCDYDTLELRALAQVCLDLLGFSSMAEALHRGEDLHLSLAAGDLLNMTIEEAQERYAAGDPVVKEYRQQAKVANFGFPGGLGADSFRVYAEGFGLIISDAQAHALRDAWFNRWSEMKPYFELITNLTDRSDQLRQVRSGRVRGGASFCAAANGFFQGLAADGAKEALWMVAKECYLHDPWGTGPTPLYGCRPVLFLHDEIGIEVPLAHPWDASQAADRLSYVMIEAMKKWIPDIPISCKPVMCKRWYKGAEAVRINYRGVQMLVPSRPVKIDGKTKWVADVEQELSQVA